MALSNAEKQRAYINRLKAAAAEALPQLCREAWADQMAKLPEAKRRELDDATLHRLEVAARVALRDECKRLAKLTTATKAKR
jgi:hypothetical protein